MDRELLKGYLDQALSLEQIGRLVDRDPSTVGYWVKKHGLVAVNQSKHAGRGGIPRADLERLVDGGMSIRQIAAEIGFSASAVRHWLAKYELTSRHAERRKLFRRARQAGLTRVTLDCASHGSSEYYWNGMGFRCMRCNSEAVSKRRRKVKRILVEEAGGRCQLCGYDKHPSALEFHHVDPSQKEFSLSHAGVTRSLEKARSEAQKCVLLCANCHAEVEAGVATVS
jgi:hypothetical protein